MQVLVISGNDLPKHPWQETSSFLKQVFESLDGVYVDVHKFGFFGLDSLNLMDYDVVILNYCNWKDETTLRDLDKDIFEQFTQAHKGLMILHFACAAFHASLPQSVKNVWPAYTNVCARVWDHAKPSEHDDFGECEIVVTSGEELLVHALPERFTMRDELYFDLVGEKEIDVFLSAFSEVKKDVVPLAWTYQKNDLHVVQSVLGHNLESYKNLNFLLII